MSKHSDAPRRNLVENSSEPVTVVHHLATETSDELRDLLNYHEVERDTATCHECGEPAEWHVSRITNTEGLWTVTHGRANEFVCDDCIDPELVEMWTRWPWTPDELRD